MCIYTHTHTDTHTHTHTHTDIYICTHYILYILADCLQKCNISYTQRDIHVYIYTYITHIIYVYTINKHVCLCIP